MRFYAVQLSPFVDDRTVQANKFIHSFLHIRELSSPRVVYPRVVGSASCPVTAGESQVNAVGPTSIKGSFFLVVVWDQVSENSKDRQTEC